MLRRRPAHRTTKAHENNNSDMAQGEEHSRKMMVTTPEVEVQTPPLQGHVILGVVAAQLEPAF